MEFLKKVLKIIPELTMTQKTCFFLQGRPIQIDPYGRGSLGRPTPAYQRRQL